MVLSGCGEHDSRTASAAAADTTAPAVDTDSDLVADVVRGIEGALRTATATGAAFPALRASARAFVAVHRAHLVELGEHGKDRPGGKATGSAADAKAHLLAVEEKLQGRLVAAALAAESGALAQVFAAMAAAVAQQRTVAA